MEMLRYAEELRDPTDFFDEVPPEKPAKEMVDLAVQLITQKSAPFRPEKFEDHYQTALQGTRAREAQGPQDHCGTRRAPHQGRQRR